MNEAESRLAEDRQTRRSARGLFDTRLAQVKADLAARGVPARIKAKAQDETFKAIDKGIDIAKESKGVIAATAGALLVWAFRAPLLKAAKGLFGQGSVQDQDLSDDGNANEEQQA
ncbi:MAG TPA: hypothetical protein VFV30_02275 [Novosphingobium sp.]|nr:hypothetical protein [Novosphingobium sp.]